MSGGPSMYIRVKRGKVTIMVSCTPTDCILEIKNKLQSVVDVPPEKLKLVKGPLELDDAKTLEDMGVQNDDIVAMCFLNQDGSGFEEPNIVYPRGAEGAEEGPLPGEAS